jgi:hypothetical protein
VGAAVLDWLQRELGVKLDEANLLVAIAGVIIAALVALMPPVGRSLPRGEHDQDDSNVATSAGFRTHMDASITSI